MASQAAQGRAPQAGVTPEGSMQTIPTSNATKPFRSRFNPALEDIRMSPIVSISEEARTRAQEFEKTGKKFVFFQRGEIDFPTPAFIIEAAKRGLDLGLTKYPKSGGEDFFKQAVINRLRAAQDVNDVPPSHVVAPFGGQESLELAFKLF